MVGVHSSSDRVWGHWRALGWTETQRHKREEEVGGGGGRRGGGNASKKGGEVGALWRREMGVRSLERER